LAPAGSWAHFFGTTLRSKNEKSDNPHDSRDKGLIEMNLFWHGRCEIIFEKEKGGESDEDRDIVFSSIAARE
jgi:hypothetical protein